MKRFLSILIISLLPVFSLYCTDYFSLNLSSEINLINGEINEYVFNKSIKNIDNKESQLDWDIKNIPVLSFSGSLDILKYFNVSIDSNFGIPKSSGNMQDYDWLNSISWPAADPTELTNYSIHDNHLDKLISLYVSAGGNIYLPAEIKLIPFIAYQYSLISFNSYNGYKTYKSDNWEKVDLSGKVISYIHEINSMLLGFKIIIDTLPYTRFNLDFSFSPKMTFLNALDYHYVNQGSGGTLFLDRFRNLWQINSKANIQYVINKNHSVGITGKIQYIPYSYGSTFYKYLDSEGKVISSRWIAASSNGGTKRLIWSIGINYSFSL